MNKILLFAVLVLSGTRVFSQENVQLEGKILAPGLENSSIHIINISQKTGTVNNAAGIFKIPVKVGDTLLFSSIQYTNREVGITRAMLDKNYLEVTLEEDVNVLAEVNISNIKLTGNINTDLDNIVVVKDLPLGLSFAEIQHLRFESDINDPQKAPEHLAFRNNMIGDGAGSLNILGGIGMLTDLLGIKNEKKVNTYTGPIAPMSVQIRERFNDDFFKSSLGIKESRIRDFLFFLDDQGISAQMLNQKNQLALIDLLIEQSKKYKEINSFD